MRDFNLTLSDIPNQHQEFAQLIGIDKFIEVCDIFGGSNVYIPTLKTITNSSRKEDILKMYYEKGMSYSEIAREFNLSNNYIRYIIKTN